MTAQEGSAAPEALVRPGPDVHLTITLSRPVETERADTRSGRGEFGVPAVYARCMGVRSQAMGTSERSEAGA